MNELAVFVLLALATRAAGDCRGGLREGAVVENDPYWYRCEGSRMRSAGCMDDNGRRVNINEIYDGSTYAYRCAKTSGGHPTIEMAACLWNGRRVDPGRVEQTYDYWFTCERSGQFLSGKIGGCVFEGRRINLEDQVRKDGNVLKCQLNTDGKAHFISVGCIHKSREYKIGETFNDNRFFYTCRRQEKKCTVQTLGCVHRGKRLSAFQNYHDGDQLYRCLFTPDLKRAQHVLEGCVKRDAYSGLSIERKIGCVWEDGRAPNMYLTECVNSTATGRAEIQRIRCMYEGPEGYAEVMPGCWSEVGRIGVGCKASSGRPMEIVTFAATDRASAHYHGLQYWLDAQHLCLAFRRRK